MLLNMLKPCVYSHLSRNAIRLCSSLSVPSQLYDVVICGGGMIGATLATSLGHNPVFKDKNILLIESNKLKKLEELPKVYSNRTCAINPGTRCLFEDIGAWQHIDQMRYQPWKKMQVWDSCSDASIAFEHEDMTNNLAYLIENDIILESVNRQLIASPNKIDVLHDSKIKDVVMPDSHNSTNVESNWTQVYLEDGRMLETRLLVAADGFKSEIRNKANIHTLTRDYKSRALVATVQLSEETDNYTAWQRFLPTGPVALLPISNTHSCLVWSTTNEQAQRLLQMEPDSFVDAVNHAFWSDDWKDPATEYCTNILENVFSVFGNSKRASHQLPPTIVKFEEGTRASFPLGLTHATHYVKDRLVLIGDSAHRIHPMAGQGANLGFGDVICLVDILKEAVMRGSDIGCLDHLLEYESRRQREVIPTVTLTDGLHTLFGSSFSPVVLLRSLGLQFVNSVNPLKTLLVEQATKRS